MSNANIGFVQLHRPGRLTVVIAVAVLILIIGAYFTMMVKGIMNWYVLGVFVLLPIVLLIFDSVSRKRILKRGTQKSELASQLKELKIRWLLLKKGGGVRLWNRVERGLPRTIADSSLKEQLNKVIIPQGLIEPEHIRTSKPGSLLGCIVGVAFSAFVIWGIFLATRMMPSSARTFMWVVAAILFWNIVQLILGLPVVHRSRKLPSFIREIGRRRMFSKPLIIGPGWVKRGETLWRADRDMLIIRRTGFRLASSEIDCLFAGPENRRRMTFSGIGDEDFQLLFGAWNVDDVRLEFVDSELS